MTARHAMWNQLLIGCLGSILGGWILQIANSLYNYLRYVNISVPGEDNHVELRIDSPDSIASIFFYGIASSAVIYFALFILPHQVKDANNRKLCRVIGLLLSAAVIFLFFYFTVPTRIGSTEIISGEASPLGYEYCLAVRPLESDLAHIQGTVAPDNYGAWERKACFGGRGEFSIILFVNENHSNKICTEGKTIFIKEVHKNKFLSTRRVVRKD